MSSIRVAQAETAVPVSPGPGTSLNLPPFHIVLVFTVCLELGLHAFGIEVSLSIR